MNTKFIELDMKDIYSMNEILSLYSSFRGPRAGYAKRKKAVNSVKKQMKKYIDDGIIFEWPSALLFEWHIPNKHRDPDNVSSGGRKAIFDGWQKTPLNEDDENSKMFLPNDNCRHLRGFIDKYVYDKHDFVRIYQINEDFINNLGDN